MERLVSVSETIRSEKAASKKAGSIKAYSRNFGDSETTLLPALNFSPLQLCQETKNIGELEQSVKALRRDIGDLRSIQAQHNTKIEEIKNEMRGLTGKVEEVQHTSVGKTQELEQTISKLQARVPPPPGIPEALLNQDDERIAPLTGPAADMYRQGLAAIRTGKLLAPRQHRTVCGTESRNSLYRQRDVLAGDS